MPTACIETRSPGSVRHDSKRKSPEGTCCTANGSDANVVAWMRGRSLVLRARRELMATGATARKRSISMSDELTPQESHVAQLASDGLSNREIGAQLFLSPRTVEYHLRKAFTKLGISSRLTLRAALARGEEDAESA
jgi:DNA-binding NarL/FixJ family response regulator